MDVHVARLRDKLREQDERQVVVTVRGQGYRLSDDARLDERQGGVT